MSEGDHLKVISNPDRGTSDEAPGSAAEDSDASSRSAEGREPDVVGRTLHLPRKLIDKLDQLAEFLEVDGSELATAALRRYVEESARNLASALHEPPTGSTPVPRTSPPKATPTPDAAASGAGRADRADSGRSERPDAVDSPGAGDAGSVSGAAEEGEQVDATAVDADSRELLEACVGLLQGLGGKPLHDAQVRRVLGKVADRAHGRDYSPPRHPHEVARLSRLLADEMIDSEDELVAIEAAGLLHDVGKILVPVELLRKRGALTPREQHRVKSYPEFGAEILEQCPALEPIVPLVRHHKERWDGAGYPAGLRGDDIPRGARIVGLAEAYHAMLSPRPYRPALPVETAREAIERRSGEVWCPEAADVLLKVVERDGPHPWESSPDETDGEGGSDDDAS